MRAVAAVLTIALLGCFPHNAAKRRYAQYGEGVSILAGIGLNYAINSGADCEQMVVVPGQPIADCKDKATILGDVGLALILAGLVGFVATISTAEDDKEVVVTKVQEEKTSEEKPALKLPGAKSTADAPSAGSAQ